MRTIRVLIADESIIARVGLKKLLHSGKITVVGEVERLQDVPQYAYKLRPRAIVLSGLWAEDYNSIFSVINQLKSKQGPKHLWVIAIVDDAVFQEAVDAGADDVLPLHLTKRMLVDAVTNCLLSDPKRLAKTSRVTMTLRQQQRLYDFLVKHFNLEELATLCFVMSIPFEDIAGDIRDAKARNLILWCQRRSRINELRKISKHLRPGTI